MSLYGALFSGVSGLQSQSSAMGAISDNITNVNTVGYKGTTVNFQTLVTTQVATTEYSPGGVQSKPRAGIDVQGLLQATNSSSDVAMSGQGFFVVNSSSNPSVDGGAFAYTRAGSFKPNKDGYLQNATGYYLQGWPLTPTDNSPAAVPGQVGINGTTYMKAYKNNDGTFHYVNQNIINTSEVRPLNLNTIGGTAQPTSSVAMGANLPSGDPIYDPNHPELGGVHTTNVLTYDSLGNTGNAQFTWTKSADNGWSLTGTPPSGAAVLNLTNYSTANGALVYASQGQLEFRSLPPVKSYFQLGPASAKATNPTVQVQFYNSGTAGSSDPTVDTPATVNGQPNVSILGVDLNGVTNTNELATAIKNALSSASDAPSVKKTYTIADTLLGGVADGASRFTADSNVLRIIQEPKASAVLVNCVSNSTTLLGNSIIQSATGVGSSALTPGVFTVPSIYDGGSVTNTAAYGTYSTTEETQNFTVSNSLGMTGSKSFTLATANTPANGGSFVMTTSKGTLSIPWANIDGAALAGTSITVDWTPTGGALQHNLVITLANNAAYPIAGGTQAADSQNLAFILNNVGTGYIPAQVTASFTAATETVRITNAGDTTSSGAAYTPSIIPNSAGTTAADVLWNDGAAGNGPAETLSNSGVLQIGKVQIPWSQINSGNVYSTVVDGASPTVQAVGPFNATTTAGSPSGTMITPVDLRDQNFTLAGGITGAVGNFLLQSSAGTLSVPWANIKATALGTSTTSIPVTFTTPTGVTTTTNVTLGSTLSNAGTQVSMTANLSSILNDRNMSAYLPPNGFVAATTATVGQISFTSSDEAIKLTISDNVADTALAGYSDQGAPPNANSSEYMGSLSAAQSTQNAIAVINNIGLNNNGGVTATAYSSNAPTTITLNSGSNPVQLFANNGGAAKDIVYTNGVDASLATNAKVMGQTGIFSSADGQAVAFNGDGTPKAIIPNSMELYWANGSENQVGTSGTSTIKPQIGLKLGNLNQSDGVTQLGGNYQVNYLTQNGSKFGNFSGISIGSDGIVTALFDNGVRSPVFQIPIATFANPDGMSANSGNVWIDTSASGAYTLRHPGEAGSGTVAASSLEASTVDLGTEFTNMITVQNAYSAAAKIITTTNQLLTDLINIKQ